MITLGSLFDGIGGWLIAAKRAGVKPLWSSEIEKVPLKVTETHFPDVEQVGDITNLTGYILEPVDIITLGSPCQGLSLAGFRKGLKDNRSGLFLEAIRIINEMREKTNGEYPKYAVWENVTGAFSSNKRMDFRAVIESFAATSIPVPRLNWAKSGMVRCKSGTCGWRTLDAQYWGVPQHRQRIFLVNHFGTGGGVDEILFKPQSMSGNINEGQEEQQGSPNGLNRDSQTSSSSVINERGGYGLTVTEDKTGTLRSTGHIPILNDQGGQCMSVTKNKVNSLLCSTYKHPPITYDMTHPCDVIRVREGAVQTLQARMGTGGNGVPLVKCVAGNLVDRECHMHGVGVKDDCAYTLNTVDKHAITVYPQKSYSEYGKGEPLSSLKNSGGNFGGGSESLVGEPKLRRLTPLECERLQGLPDNWTAVEGASNSARYRAIGNGMAQPCADFIIRRIAEYMRKECT